MARDEKWWEKQSRRNHPVYIYHYTSSERGLLILEQGRLRLGPFSSANDPFEFLPWVPAGVGKGAEKNTPGIMSLKSRCNFAAFATDQMPPSDVPGEMDVHDRGFGSPPMWAHYGDKYRGVCLVFNRERLVQAVEQQLVEYSEEILKGTVKYESPLKIPTTEAGESAIEYLRRCSDGLVLRKHAHWSYENEYRIATVAKMSGSQHVVYEGALCGLVVGYNSCLRAEAEALEKRHRIPVKNQEVENGIQYLIG